MAGAGCMPRFPFYSSCRCELCAGVGQSLLFQVWCCLGASRGSLGDAQNLVGGRGLAGLMVMDFKVGVEFAAVDLFCYMELKEIAICV
jgi:hypothetical protein